MKEFLAHFFVPRSSNKHRSRSLHFSSLLVYLILLSFVHVGLNQLSRHTGLILGYASNINVTDLLTDTNQKRKELGLSTLVLNDQLSQAAAAKAQNMFTEQYWAHVSPSKKDPWGFIRQFGYNYLYAGENLARDFGDSPSVVNAWMNSPSHKENLVNPHFKDVGFAVVNGKYGDYETTLVVQMLGAKTVVPPTIEVAEPALIVKTVEQPIVPKVTTEVAKQPVSESKVSGVGQQTVTPSPNRGVDLGIFNLTKIVLGVLGVFLLASLALDSLVVFRKKAFRLASHNSAHFLIIVGTLVTIVLMDSGLII